MSNTMTQLRIAATEAHQKLISAKAKINDLEETSEAAWVALESALFAERDALAANRGARASISLSEARHGLRWASRYDSTDGFDSACNAMAAAEKEHSDALADLGKKS